jgi:nicotinate-nucleotide--dimethylbenzimidazole phosphoribosyltransferase
VTTQIVRSFLAVGAAINVLAQLHEVEVTVINVGVVDQFEDAHGQHGSKIGSGSRNVIREPAMTH